MTLKRYDHDRLKEIRDEMADLLVEAGDIVRHADRFEYDRAKAYWFTYIENAIDEDARSPLLACTMGSTIKALEPDDEDDEDEDEEDED